MSSLVMILINEYPECVLNFQMLGILEYRALARELKVSIQDVQAAMVVAVSLANDTE